ncbi:hypothetical protein CTI12_AA311840 [Artemisia annua]|uniref:Helitron helicase-like domain-containing protein n=1 Tax=Artemisia annua TaxID=35608 RepID=A0A2U1N2L1_ARTAN|nr:hypothetical protein CTI12_AA311840 [Artemisia annua]
MDQNKQRNVRKRKKEVSSSNKPQASNQILPLSETITPASNKRVSLAELLTYDPVNSSLPSSHLPNTSSTQSKKLKGSFARSTGPQPKAPYRSPLADITNRCPQTLNDVSNVCNSTRVSSLPFFQGSNSQTTNPILSTNTFDTFPTRLSPLTPSLTTNVRQNTTPEFRSQLGPVSITPQQPKNVGTTSSSNTLNRTPNSGTSILSQTPLPLNTVNNVNRGMTTRNSSLKSSTQSTPVVATSQRNRSPLTNVSNVCFETPEVHQVHQRTYQTSTSGVKTSIPAIITRNSSYEVGESSRRPKRSKRPALQPPTPVRFNLNDEDGNVRKVYDKYVGISEDYYDHGDATFVCKECHALLWEAEARRGNQGNPANKAYSICCSKGKHPKFWFNEYKLTICSNSKSSSCSSNSKHPIDRNIINEVQGVLDTSSDLVQTFRRACDRYTEDIEQNIKIKLIAKRGKDGRNYNLPTANEVAGLIVGDFDSCAEQRDIVIDKHGEGLQRINIFHPMYLPLQYPLLMPRAQDGYHLNIPLIKKGSQTARDETDNEPKKKTVTMRQWFSYQIMDRPNQENLFTRGGRLFQQFLVDGYTMVETERLYFHRAKQSKLRCDTYSNIRHSIASGNTDPTALDFL